MGTEAHTPEVHGWLTRLLVQSATPGVAEALMRMAFEIDVRDVAAAIAGRGS